MLIRMIIGTFVARTCYKRTRFIHTEIKHLRNVTRPVCECKRFNSHLFFCEKTKIVLVARNIRFLFIKSKHCHRHDADSFYVSHKKEMSHKSIIDDYVTFGISHRHMLTRVYECVRANLDESKKLPCELCKIEDFQFRPDSKQPFLLMNDPKIFIILLARTIIDLITRFIHSSFHSALKFN